MAEIGAGSGTGYPSTLDTDTTQETNSPAAGKTKARAEVPNDLAAAIIAIETELGTDPAGSLADVKTFLQLEHNADGTHDASLVAMLAGAQTIAGDKTFSGSSVFSGTVALNAAVTAAAAAGSAFSANRNNVVQSLNDNTWTKIKWTTEVFDTISDFSHDANDSGGATESRHTPSIAGKYLYIVSTYYGTTADDKEYGAGVYLNGSQTHVALNQTPGTGGITVQCTFILDMNGSTDYVEAFGYQNSGGALDLDGSIINTYFHGSRIF